MGKYDTLPLQARLDVDECVNAYYYGGSKLATVTFRAIAHERGYVRWVSSAMAEIIRNRLKTLGYLQIGA